MSRLFNKANYIGKWENYKIALTQYKLELRCFKIAT